MVMGVDEKISNFTIEDLFNSRNICCNCDIVEHLRGAGKKYLKEMF